MEENVENKHAYLFMIMNNLKVFEKALKMIDDERNDIYIHVDLKSKEIEQIRNITNKILKSKVFLVKRLDVRWGTYSLVECEMILLEEATKNNGYKYYHLLSESDLPLKNQDQIHDFFDMKQGEEFIEFQNFSEESFFSTRYKCYHIFKKNMKSKNKLVRYSTYICEKIFLLMQYLLKIDITKKYNMKIQYGSQWFSITDEFARYILKNKQLIFEIFRHGLCVDEHFLQTIAYNSKFKEKISKEGNMRLIIWKKNKNSPYVFRDNDYTTLMGSEKLFARKFQEQVDFGIVEKIYKNIKEREK